MPRRIVENPVRVSIGDGIFLTQEELSQQRLRYSTGSGWVDDGMQKIRIVPEGTFGIVEATWNPRYSDYLVVLVSLPDDDLGPATDRHIFVHERRVRLA